MNIRPTTSTFSRARRTVAFTLVELLVIVAIIGILLASGVPAIRNMIYTSTGSLAESQLRFALGAARDLAIRSASGDSAAVFTFEPSENGRGRLTIVPMVYVGTILDTRDPDKDLSQTTVTTYRDVFAPSALAEPTQLPAGWMVRGFAPPGTIWGAGQQNFDGVPVPSNGWYYESSPAGNRIINAPGAGGTGNDPLAIPANAPNKGNWVFPETAFYDPEKTDTGGSRPNSRNTFMVRFQSGTGRIVGMSWTPSVALLPRPTIDATKTNALPKQSTGITSPSDWRRIDRADNIVGWARSVASMPNPTDAAALIGCRSADAALAGTVNLIALYDESKLASAIGARGLSKVTGSLYGGAANKGGVIGSASAATEVPKAPNLDLSLFPSTSIAATDAEYVQVLINSYIINALKYSNVDGGSNTTFIDSDARIFTLDTYMGSTTEAK